MVRGDTFASKFLIRFKDERNVEKSDIETLFITFKNVPEKNSEYIFQKTLDDVEISDGYCHFIFEPNDTEYLEYKKYYFDTSVTLKNGVRKTKTYSITLTKKTTDYNKESGGVEGI